jgi:hypothetical protein
MRAPTATEWQRSSAWTSVASLAPGRYLVTPRAVTPKVVVRELGRPRVIRIR